MIQYRTGSAGLYIPGVEVRQVQGGGQLAALYASLVAYWKLDEASGARADSVGANHLTDNNTVASATGLVYPLAADFVAANSEYLSVADNAALSMGDINFWMASWVKLDLKTTDRYILAKGAAVDNRDYSLAYFSASDRFGARVFDSSGNSITAAIVLANSLGAPSTGVWYFITAWHDAAANTVNIQVNNGIVDSASTTAAPGDSTGGLRLGNDAVNSTFFLDGLLGPTMFGKNHVPSVAEHTALYNGGAGLTLAQMAVL